MKINFKYINKNILAIIMAGSMVAPLSACSAGDDKVDSSKGMIYSYDQVSKYQIMELETPVGTQIYLTEETGIFTAEYYKKSAPILLWWHYRQDQKDYLLYR